MSKTSYSSLVISDHTAIAQGVTVADDETIASLAEILQTAGMSLVVSWPGFRARVGSDFGDAGAEVAFRSRKIAEKALTNVSLRTLAQAYLNGDMAIVGDMLAAMPVIETINVATDRPRTWWEAVGELLFRASKLALPWRRTRFESLDHYAKSAGVYAQMLGEHMQYTCGRFRGATDSIDEAQQQKFALIHDWFVKHGGPTKSRTHLDIGCGWGGLVHYFSTTYHMQSAGLTNSQAQFDYARTHHGEHFVLADFSQMLRWQHDFDCMTIVGMIEHLTPSRRNELLELVLARLRPDGLVYLQCIQRPRVWIGGDAYRLVQEEIFPGHYLESDTDTRSRLERLGFEVLEYRDDAKDYAATTAMWFRNVERHQQMFESVLGPQDYRLFTGYLALASQLFASGRGSLGRYLLRRRA